MQHNSKKILKTEIKIRDKRKQNNTGNNEYANLTLHNITQYKNVIEHSIIQYEEIFIC